MSSPASQSSSTGATKRQRTINDMFGGGGGGKSVAPPAKKAKLSGSGAVASGSKAVAAPTLGFRTKLNGIPFSLTTFEASLSEEERSLLQLEIETFGKGWFKILQPEFKKRYFLDLKRFLRDLGVRASDTPKSVMVYPPARDIYSWTATPLGKIKCVIIGQDPYHGSGQAHGLCFSVRRGVTIPPSLRNIYQEIKANYPEFDIPKHGDLSEWAKNGVLLLNTSFTVNAGQAGSHAGKGWEQFTEMVIKAVDKWGGANLPLAGSSSAPGVGQGVAILAWGAHAAKRVATLDKTKHLILSSAHPSPYSANRGFLGNKHFSLVNEWLEKKYGPEGRIDWCNLDPIDEQDQSPLVVERTASSPAPEPVSDLPTP